MTKKQRAKLGLILLPIGSIISLLLLWMVLVWPIYKTFQSRNWPQVECIIDTYHVSEAGIFQNRYGSHVQYKLEIRYNYCFGNKQYVGSETSFSYTKPLPITSKIKTCYVNPNNPSEAVLSRQYHIYLLISLFPAIALGMCIYGFYRCVKIVS